jgi:hypothetical protein
MASVLDDIVLGSQHSPDSMALALLFVGQSMVPLHSVRACLDTAFDITPLCPHALDGLEWFSAGTLFPRQDEAFAG